MLATAAFAWTPRQFVASTPLRIKSDRLTELENDFIETTPLSKSKNRTSLAAAPFCLSDRMRIPVHFQFFEFPTLPIGQSVFASRYRCLKKKNFKLFERSSFIRLMMNSAPGVLSSAENDFQSRSIWPYKLSNVNSLNLIQFLQFAIAESELFRCDCSKINLKTVRTVWTLMFIATHLKLWASYGPHMGLIWGFENATHLWQLNLETLHITRRARSPGLE